MLWPNLNKQMKTSCIIKVKNTEVSICKTVKNEIHNKANEKDMLKKLTESCKEKEIYIYLGEKHKSCLYVKAT